MTLADPPPPPPKSDNYHFFFEAFPYWTMKAQEDQGTINRGDSGKASKKFF